MCVFRPLLFETCLVIRETFVECLITKLQQLNADVLVAVFLCRHFLPYRFSKASSPVSCWCVMSLEVSLLSEHARYWFAALS